MNVSLPRRLVLVGEPGLPYFEKILGLNLPIEIAVVDPLALDEQEVVLGDADALLLWRCAPELLTKLFTLAKQLRWVHTHSAGVETLPLELLCEREIVLTNAAGVFAGSLAEFAITGILYFAKDVPRLLRNQRAGVWEQFDVQEVGGKTAIIIGYGGIGRATAERLKAMRVNVIACRNRTQSEPCVDRVIRPSELQSALPEADYVIVTAPLTPETRGMLGAAELRLLKRSAVVINVGRGPIIEEQALVHALERGEIRGAALDVFDVEPLPSGHPFYRMENVLLSPHSTDHTEMWLWDTLELFISQLRSVLAGGELANVVDLGRGY